MFRPKTFLSNRIKSFSYAFNGIKLIIKTQPNFIVHVCILTIVILTGIYFNITIQEWTNIITVSSLVLFAEITNTAIEKLCDYVSPEFDEYIGIIKDIAAAGVLITAITAAAIGIMIFFPKFYAIF